MKKTKILTIKKIFKLKKKHFKKKTFFIIGKKSFKNSGAKKTFKDILNKNDTLVFEKKGYIPEVNELKKIIRLIKKHEPKIIYAVGGGTVIDLAKVSNFFINEKNLKKSILFNKRFSKTSDKKRILVAVPTTAGSGAEVTSNAVVYINKKKYSVEDPQVKPDKFILNPLFVKNNPIKLRAASGFDTFAQSVESMFSIKSSKKSLNFSIQSLKLTLKSFLNYLRNKNIRQSSEDMIRAANLSGEAINLTKTISPHAVSYPFTSHFGISHGFAVALTFNEFLEHIYYNREDNLSQFNLNERFKILFNLTETNNFEEFRKFLNNFKIKSGIKDTFKENNINISKKINLIMNNINVQRLKNNPVKLNYDDLRRILLNKY